MIMGPIGSTKGIAMLLISLGVGYLVCTNAEGQKGFLKQLGYWIGSIIIILSILAALRVLYFNICKSIGIECIPAKICPLVRAK